MPNCSKSEALTYCLYLVIFLGLPRPAGGSGCVLARSSARPCSFFAALKNLGLRLRRPSFHPSAVAGFACLGGGRLAAMHFIEQNIVCGPSQLPLKFGPSFGAVFFAAKGARAGAAGI